jgi:hypothetical protein
MRFTANNESGRADSNSAIRLEANFVDLASGLSFIVHPSFVIA